MKKKSLQMFYILIFAFVIMFIAYRFFKESKENNLLTSYLETTAILTTSYQGTARTPSSGDFVYIVNDKEYKFSQSGNYYKYMNIGDTVLIKYAIEDHSVARVKDSYYMKKYKHLKNR